ncbi:hypothetical protein [Demequina pelophila]|uniref:hypothetical protein n=1 Tax=Demequina pelophila TaxID=1638984 RepID=UPI0007837EFD|nr:hypothetical protein [Demequina pelophila]
MSALPPDDEDALEIEVEEFRELYADDPDIAARVHAAVRRDHPDRASLADAVVDSLIAGSDMHDDEAAIDEVIDACRRLMPLAPVIAHLRAEGQSVRADLLESAPAAAGRWLSEGGWAIHDAEGEEVAFVFARPDVDRSWVMMLDGGR